MAMKKKQPASTDLLEEIDIHPHSDSWTRITTRNNRIGLVIVLALVALIIVAMALRLTRGDLVVLGVLGALILVGLIWKSVPQRKKGLLGDAEMNLRIKADIMTELNAHDVHVSSAKGVVTLRGTVPYADFRDAAQHLAQRQGAHQVINELTPPRFIHPPDSNLKGFPGVTTSEGGPEDFGWMPLEQKVRAALEDDPRVNAYVLVARVENGMAYLTGRQETTQASAAAAEVALHIPGILGVSNEIEIMPSC